MRYRCGGPARALGYGSKVGNQAQAGFSIVIGREIWDEFTLAGRCTANCPHFFEAASGDRPAGPTAAGGGYRSAFRDLGDLRQQRLRFRREMERNRDVAATAGRPLEHDPTVTIQELPKADGWIISAGPGRQR